MPMTAQQDYYRRSIDLARIAAALGIVWAHAHAPGRIVGYVALSLFLVLTGFLAVQSLQRSKGRFTWLARVQRIALPWMFWSLFFIAVDSATADTPRPLLSDPWSLLVGSTIHLWFLPFVMLASLLVPLLVHLVQTPRALVVACAGLVLISPPLLWAQAFVPLPVPLPQWGYALPPFIYGILAAIGHRQGNVMLPLATAALISAITFAGAPMFWAVQMVLAAVLFEVLWRVELRNQAVAALGKLAFGIYLVHPFFMLVTYKLFGGGVNAAFAALLIFAMSLAATWMLRRIPGLRRIV